VKNTSAPPDLGPTLGFLALLWELNHSLEVTSGRMRSVLGVTAQQRVILRIVGKFPRLSAGELSRLLRLDAGTVSATLGRLERRGLITRTRDPRDRRRVELGLTAAGRRLDVPTACSVEHVVAGVLASRPRAERDAACALLSALAASLTQPDSTLESKA
jgi:DNA-binding MarR family transcriptional regulator